MRKTLFAAALALAALSGAEAAGIRTEGSGESFRVIREDDGNIVGGGRVIQRGGMENFEIIRLDEGPAQPRRVPVPMGSGEGFRIEYR